MTKLEEKQNIPNGWREAKLLDCLSVPSKLAGIKLSEYEKEGDFPVFDQGQDYVSGYSSKKDLVVENVPAILFGDHTRIVKYIKSPFVAGADGTKIFWAKDGFDSTFLYYLVTNQKIPNTGYNRHFKFFKDIKVMLPESKTEQQKIAEILETVDENIAKTQEIIEATERFKRGLMQQLFTRGIGHTKFKKTKIGMVPEEWDVIAIKDAPIELVDGDRGINYPKLSDFSSGGYCLFLNNKNIKGDQFIFSDIQFVSREKDESLRKGKLHRHDVVLTTRGTVGNVAYYNDEVSFENIRINSGMILLRACDDLNPDYLYHLMKSPLLKKRYAEVSSGSAQPQLPIRSLEQIHIPIPPEGEQEKMTEIAVAIDEKISVNQKLKTKLALLKKGLMQDLLSGKKRV